MHFSAGVYKVVVPTKVHLLFIFEENDMTTFGALVRNHINLRKQQEDFTRSARKSVIQQALNRPEALAAADTALSAAAVELKQNILAYTTELAAGKQSYEIRLREPKVAVAIGLKDSELAALKGFKDVLAVCKEADIAVWPLMLGKEISFMISVNKPFDPKSGSVEFYLKREAANEATEAPEKKAAAPKPSK